MREELKIRKKYAARGTTLEDLLKERYGPITGDEVMAWVNSHNPEGAFQRNVQTVWTLKQMYEDGTLEVRGNEVALMESGEEPWVHKTIEKAGLGDLW